MARLDPLFQQMRQQATTDLHLAAGVPPRVRVRGELEPMLVPPLSAADIVDSMRELLTADQEAEFALYHDVEFTYALPGVARFRASYFLTAGGPSAVFRLAGRVVSLQVQSAPQEFQNFQAGGGQTTRAVASQAAGRPGG